MYPFLCSSIWSLGVDQTVCRTHLANLKPLIENGTIVAGGWFSLFFFFLDELLCVLMREDVCRCNV